MGKFFRILIYLFIIIIIIAIWTPSLLMHEKVDIGEVYLPTDVIGIERKKVQPFSFKDGGVAVEATTPPPRDSIVDFEDENIADDIEELNNSLIGTPQTSISSDDVREKVGIWVFILKEVLTHLNELITLLLGIAALKTYRKTGKTE